MSVESRGNTSRRQDFLFSLDTLRSTNIQEYDFTSFVSRGADERDPRDFLPNKEGLHVDQELYREWAQSSSLPNRVGFEFEDGLAIGREDSRNEVFFGTAVLSRFDGSTDERLKVAVKPYESDQFDGDRYMADELTMMQKAKKRDLKVPEAVAVLKQDDRMFMVSRFKPEIITQDSVDWKNLDAETTERTMQRGVASLAELHSHGLFHGDAVPRNITIQPDMNSIWHVDLEHGRDTHDPLDTEVNMKKDLYDYYVGICGLRDVQPSHAGMVEEILEPYQRIMIEKLNCDDAVEPESLRTITQLFDVLSYDLEMTFAGEPLKMIDRKDLVSAKGLGSLSCANHFSFG